VSKLNPEEVAKIRAAAEKATTQKYNAMMMLPGTVIAMCDRIEDLSPFEALEENSWDLRCVNVPTGGDDYDIIWEVIEHYQATPRNRTIAGGITPVEAIKQALKPRIDEEQ